MEKAMISQKRWWKKLFLTLGIGAIILAGTPGCEAMWDHEPYLSQPKINAGPQEVFLKSQNPNLRNLRLALLPFRVPAQVTDVSYSITEVFQRQLLEKRPFLGVVRVHKYYDSIADAQRLAKEQGAQLMVLGEVPYFIDSGTTATSGVQVDLRVVEVSTGQTVWYLSDNIMAKPAPMMDLWVTETKPKPAPSIYFLVDTLAARMTLALVKDLEPAEAKAMAAQSASSGSKKPAPQGICNPNEGDLPEICRP